MRDDQSDRQSASLRIQGPKLLVRVALAIAVTIVMPVSAKADPISGGGSGEGLGSGCQASPAACLGASVVIPGGTAGATLGRGDCLGGRIVTPETGGQSDSIPYCPDVDGDGVSDSPPSHGQVVAALCPRSAVPTPILATSPDERGFTGLDTWFWSAGSHDVSFAATVAGYAVGCRITAAGFDVDTGDIHAAEFGTPRSYSSTDPGHEGEDTDITHLYERWGTFQQTLTITWQRTTSVGRDTLTTSTTRDYQVVSIVSGATTPD